MTTPTTFQQKFIQLQSRTRVTKDQFNKFGNYAYRKTEDILAEVKPICAELGLFITLTDEIKLVGDRFYVVATASVQDGTNTVSSTAWAREDEKQAGMAAPQVTGSSSSYARKYALSGLLGLDDEKDADDTNTHGKSSPAPKSPEPTPKQAHQAGTGEQMTGPKEWNHVKELATKKGVKAGFVRLMQEYHKEVARLNSLPDAN